jgi:MYND finger
MQEDHHGGNVHAAGPHQCSFCKHAGTFPRCNGCAVVHYCSTKHQKDDWKFNRGFCKPIMTASKARKQGTQLDLAATALPRLRAAASGGERSASVYVVLNGEGYRFEACSSHRSRMLRRLLEFPPDRPPASLDLPRAAIEAWEAGDCSNGTSD